MLGDHMIGTLAKTAVTGVTTAVAGAAGYFGTVAILDFAEKKRLEAKAVNAAREVLRERDACERPWWKFGRTG